MEEAKHVQKQMALDDSSLGMIELVKPTISPAVHKVILIALSLLATSCMVERSLVKNMW